MLHREEWCCGLGETFGFTTIQQLAFYGHTCKQNLTSRWSIDLYHDDFVLYYVNWVVLLRSLRNWERERQKK